jgi:hypothetical protein
MLRNVLKRLRRLLRRDPKRLACCGAVWLVLLAGCAAPVRVVSECPEPSPVEARDLYEWLIEDPARPAQDWAARVIGQLYAEDLATERGETPEERSWGDWLISPFGGDAK